MSARILVLGDCCALPGETVSFDSALADLIATHDLTSCVLEGPVEPTIPNPGPRDKAGPRLCQDRRLIDSLVRARIRHFALGNNHIADHGADGIAATLAAIGSADACGVGGDDITALEPSLMTVGGLRVALFSASERQAGTLAPGDQGPGSAWICHPRLPERIAAARLQADAVMLIAHAGVEEIDHPLPQWRNHYRSLVEAGCDAVIASHPHVPQGHERHGRALVVHSLGNLYMSPQLGSTHSWWNHGMGVSLTLDGSHGVADWSPVATSFSLGHIGLGDQTRLDQRLAVLDRALADPVAYQEAVGACCDALWRDRYRTFYLAMLGLGGRGALLRQCVLGAPGAPANPVLALHNLNIESHRWAVETAMRYRLGLGLGQ